VNHRPEHALGSDESVLLAGVEPESSGAQTALVHRDPRSLLVPIASKLLIFCVTF